MFVFLSCTRLYFGFWTNTLHLSLSINCSFFVFDKVVKMLFPFSKVLYIFFGCFSHDKEKQNFVDFSLQFKGCYRCSFPFFFSLSFLFVGRIFKAKSFFFWKYSLSSLYFYFLTEVISGQRRV